MGLPNVGSYLRKMSTAHGDMAQAHQYGRSKALLLYFARELTARVSSTGRRVTVTSADPGSAWTGLTGPNKDKLIPRLIMNFGARDPLICATALVNGVSAGVDGHGKILHDFEAVGYPPFMERQSGRRAGERVWQETKMEFVEKVEGVKEVYDLLE